MDKNTGKKPKPIPTTPKPSAIRVVENGNKPIPTTPKPSAIRVVEKANKPKPISKSKY